MVQTYSSMMPLGTKAPAFELPNTLTPNGPKVTLKQAIGPKGLLVAFICNHCPYVQMLREKFVEVAHWAQEQGIGVVAISSNDVENYPQDSPQKMREMAQEFQFKFPYLYDSDQSVARSYSATCTPDFFLFDHFGDCVYRGRFDDATPGNGVKPSGSELKQALESLLESGKCQQLQRPSVGCNIKWKKLG